MNDIGREFLTELGLDCIFLCLSRLLMLDYFIMLSIGADIFSDYRVLVVLNLSNI